MIKFLSPFLVLILSACIGCEMSKGAGKDLENAGQEIQRAADKAE